MARGRLTKGGTPDLEATARTVLSDWVIGKIKYFTLPPKIDHLGQEITDDSIMLTE